MCARLLQIRLCIRISEVVHVGNKMDNADADAGCAQNLATLCASRVGGGGQGG